VGGWFDAEDLFGTLESYREIATHSPETDSRLVMGPWVHGGWNGGQGAGAALGPGALGAATGDLFREAVRLAFLEHHLKGKGPFRAPKAWVFETGTNRWREHASWPPPQTAPLTLWLEADGRLAQEPPRGGAERSFDEYVSDPARPVPHLEKVGIRM